MKSAIIVHGNHAQHEDSIMPLITCPECNHQVSDRATACPNCGCPMQNASSRDTATGVGVQIADKKPSHTEKQWFIQRDGSELGPLPSQVLLRLAEQGEVTPQTLVSADKVTWHAASAVRGLFPRSATTVAGVHASASPLIVPPSDSQASADNSKAHRLNREEITMALVKCRECCREISDRAVSCPHCGCPMPASASIHRTSGAVERSDYVSPEDLRVEGEKRSLWIGIGIIITFALLSLFIGGWLILPLIFLAAAIYIWVQQGQLVGGAVKVSRQQFPEINEVAEQAASRLGIRRPEVFIQYDPTINAFAIGFLAKKSVVLHSALVEAMQLNELHQVIGHEFTHIKCGHTNLTVLANASAINVPVVSQVLGWVFLLWKRKTEYTGDRGGLIACRDLKAAISAMCKIAVGAELFKKMNIDYFLKQQMDLEQNEGARLSETLIDHPYLVRRIQAMKDFYGSDQYRNLATRNN